MSIVYWDTMMFIYLLEGDPIFTPKVERFQREIERRGDALVTSVFTLGEVLTGPRKADDASAVSAIKSYFASGAVAILPFDSATADRYSMVRSMCKVSQADAIHLASAAVAGASAFVTNDADLRRLVIPGIGFMVDLDGNTHSPPP
ncbi:MAG: PIN domain-containing protein [Terracidiphilus sp.]